MRPALVAVCLAWMTVNAAAAPPPPGAVRGAFRVQLVVDGSAVMQRIAKRASNDPRAVELAVRATPDFWGSFNGEHHDVYLEAPARESLVAYFSELAADPKLAAESGHEFNFERVVHRDGKTAWRSYYLDAAPALDASDVASATPQVMLVDHDTEGRPVVQVELTDKGNKRLASFSTDNVGHKLAIVFDERVLSAPVIESPILYGRMTVTMGSGDHDELMKEAAALARQLDAVARPHR